jgi:hypothetical protein
LIINKDIAYRKIIKCTKATRIKIKKYLFKTKCKWEIKIKGAGSPPGVSWK